MFDNHNELMYNSVDLIRQTSLGKCVLEKPGQIGDQLVPTPTEATQILSA